MQITAEMIKALRAETSAGISDCRAALVESNGDHAKAVAWLQEKGMLTAAKRSERAASNGTVEVYSHGGGRVAVMVEVNCETDFVARSDQFRTLAHEIALQIAANGPRFVKPEDIPAEVLQAEVDRAKARAADEGKTGAIAEKIVEGYLNKFKDEVCLMRQTYIRDETMTVEKLVMQNVAAIGENLIVRRFQRWELGETAA